MTESETRSSIGHNLYVVTKESMRVKLGLQLGYWGAQPPTGVGELVDDLHIIGTEGEVRDKVAQWEETGVTTLLLSLGSAADVHRIAEVLG